MKKAYEWVLMFFNDELPNVYLTERQYEFYRDHREDKVIDFEDFSFAPSGIASSFKREANVIKDKYPCMKCNTNGYIIKGSTEREICPECEGTGVKL